MDGRLCTGGSARCATPNQTTRFVESLRCLKKVLWWPSSTVIVILSMPRYDCRLTFLFWIGTTRWTSWSSASRRPYSGVSSSRLPLPRPMKHIVSNSASLKAARTNFAKWSKRCVRACCACVRVCVGGCMTSGGQCLASAFCASAPPDNEVLIHALHRTSWWWGGACFLVCFWRVVVVGC